MNLLLIDLGHECIFTLESKFLADRLKYTYYYLYLTCLSDGFH